MDVLDDLELHPSKVPNQQSTFESMIVVVLEGSDSLLGQSRVPNMKLVAASCLGLKESITVNSERCLVCW